MNNMKRTIYIVEDDTSIQELYTFSLENEFKCLCFDEGGVFFDTLIDRITNGKKMPDLIMLDIMLPGDDGFIILLKLKANKKTAHIPVIIVSAKGEEILKVRALNMGADDYIHKPFGVIELMARVKATLRRNQRAVNAVKPIIESIKYKDVVIETNKHQIRVKDKSIQTTLKEYKLLMLLCKNAEKIQKRETMFIQVWGNDICKKSRTLDIHINVIRKKLLKAESDTIIQTVRGVGYMIC